MSEAMPVRVDPTPEEKRLYTRMPYIKLNYRGYGVQFHMVRHKFPERFPEDAVIALVDQKHPIYDDEPWLTLGSNIKMDKNSSVEIHLETSKTMDTIVVPGYSEA